MKKKKNRYRKIVGVNNRVQGVCLLKFRKSYSVHRSLHIEYNSVMASIRGKKVINEPVK